jgi:hypothetical protein
MRKLIIFGTYHEVTGLRNFRKNVIDPDYKTIIEALKQVHEVDFIFEEATGFGPSVASEVAVGRYLDIDSESTEQALSLFSEDSENQFLPEILGKSRLQQTATKLGLTVQNWREQCWVAKIKAQQFKTGLVICGVVHSLSIAFRLQSEGFEVEAYCYEPIERLFNSYV